MNIHEIKTTIETLEIRETELLPRAKDGDKLAQTCIVEIWNELAELKNALARAERTGTAPATRDFDTK